MRKIYRMALELIMIGVALIPELLVVKMGGEIMRGTEVPETVMSTAQLQGGLIMLVGAMSLIIVLGILHYADRSKQFRELENKIKTLEDEIHGMDQEAAEES